MYVFANGNRYEGPYENGRCHGRGSVFDNSAIEVIDGVSRESEWNNNLRTCWLDEERNAARDALVQILLQSNNDEIGMCSICRELYSETNTVWKYSTCNECICKTCVGSPAKTKCQMTAGCNQGEYQESLELTRVAMSGVQLAAETLITINVATLQDTQTYPISLNSDDRLLRIAEEMRNRGEVVSIALQGKVYRMDREGHRTLQEVGIDRQTLVRAIFRGQGCNKP